MYAVDIVQAYTAKIDAFALNIAAGKSYNEASIAAMFAAAESSNLGFKLFFSFDYAGNGAWKKADVLALLAKYAGHPNYFHHAMGQPLVSTFEGPESAADWVEIKRTTGCFLIPDWSSLGAKAAIELEVRSILCAEHFPLPLQDLPLFMSSVTFNVSIFTKKSGRCCRWLVQLGSLAL